MSIRGNIYCEVCARSMVRLHDEVLFTSPRRMGEAHVGTRFPGRDYRGQVTLNGQSLKNCVEAFAGRDGFVLLVHCLVPYSAPCPQCKRMLVDGGWSVERGEVVFSLEHDEEEVSEMNEQTHAAAPAAPAATSGARA